MLPVAFVGLGALTWFANRPRAVRRPPALAYSKQPMSNVANAGPLPQASANVTRATSTTDEPPIDVALAQRINALADALGKALRGSGERWSDADSAKVRALEASLLSPGAAAALPLIARINQGGDEALRTFLFQVLRQLPGKVAHDFVLMHASSGADETLRTMAIESLGNRRDEASLQTLSNIARFDAELPVQPLFDLARDPAVPDTELPHDTDVTPRLRAIAALEQMNSPAAASVLADLAQVGPDASIRMHAASHMHAYATLPNARDSLVTAAMSDRSPYVRLAAIGSLAEQRSPSVTAALAAIASSDADAGVRALAARVVAARDD